MKTTFHVEYSDYAKWSKELLKDEIERYNKYIDDCLSLAEGTYKSGHMYESTYRYTERIDQFRSKIIEDESKYNADAYGYCIQDPWTDDEYLDRIANGETIGGMML